MSTTPHGIISSVLASACTAWLRTQVSTVAELQVKIAAGNRQMLTGTIPTVSVFAQKAVYRGISLERIQLLAEQISVNLKQVACGKPLQLLQPIMVNATVIITEADLQSSLAAPLLANALTDLVTQILASNDQQLSIQWHSVTIQTNQLALHGQVERDRQQTVIAIETGIELVDGHILRLIPLTVVCALELSGSELREYAVDLGSQVDLTELTLQEGELLCSGKIQVNP